MIGQYLENILSIEKLAAELQSFTVLLRANGGDMPFRFRGKKKSQVY